MFERLRAAGAESAPGVTIANMEEAPRDVRCFAQTTEVSEARGPGRRVDHGQPFTRGCGKYRLARKGRVIYEGNAGCSKKVAHSRTSQLDFKAASFICGRCFTTKTLCPSRVPGYHAVPEKA